MREIYLIRHGMPDFPGGARMCLGRTDTPLGLRGRLQAALLGAEFEGRGIDECFCSRLSRSRQTAELMGYGSAVIVPGLEEMDAGDWDGLSFDEIRRRWPEYYEKRGRDRSLPPPGGEDFGPASLRFTAAVNRALALSRGDIIIVSHSSVIQTLLCTLEGRPFDCARDFVLPYGSVTRLEYDGGFGLREYGVLPVPELTPGLAGRLLTGGSADPDAARDALLHTMACQAAIKGGQKNSPGELYKVAEAVTSGALKYRPHGRPVASELTRQQLEKRFGRA